MKSAYELAMERLNAQNPQEVVKLNDVQREQIAEIERSCKAKLAEREVFLHKQIESARAQGDRTEEQALLKQLASDRALLMEEAEEKKEAVRKG